jgi:hypothetical protein
MKNMTSAAFAVIAVAALAAASPALAKTDHETFVGKDGKTYCRQTKGSATTATVVGGVAGALLGNVVAGHGDKRIGTVIGAAAGAGAGHAIARRKRNNCDRAASPVGI